MKVVILLTFFMLGFDERRGRAWPSRICGRTPKYRGDSSDVEVAQRAKSGQFPWMVSLQQRRQNTHICAGSIITDYVVLTAAHCVTGWEQSPEEIEVVAGILDLESSSRYNQVRRVSEFVVHEGYDNYMKDDIALIMLKKPFDFAENVGLVGPICLSRSNPPNQAKLQVAGWGGSRSEGTSRFLGAAVAPLRRDGLCRELESEYSPRLMLCSGPLENESCRGGDGGPAMLRARGGMVQVGIVSGAKNCDKVPVFYTKVASYIDWIKDKIELEKIIHS